MSSIRKYSRNAISYKMTLVVILWTQMFAIIEVLMLFVYKKLRTSHFIQLSDIQATRKNSSLTSKQLIFYRSSSSFTGAAHLLPEQLIFDRNSSSFTDIINSFPAAVYNAQQASKHE
jgi:hypothetical protein